MARYQILEDGRAIKCLTCGLTSHHPQDVAERYCGNCHVFHQHLEYMACDVARAYFRCVIDFCRKELTKEEVDALIERLLAVLNS